MIVGINGRINSGKDLVGKIIQYLTCDYGIQGTKTFEECKGKIDNEGYGYSGFTRYNFEWQIKKFADKLKDIVCLLINCTREQLEDREFKDKELGEEWWFNHIIPEHGFGSKLINWDKDLKPQKLTPRLLMQLIGTECGRDIIHPNIWVNSLMSEYKPISGKFYYRRTEHSDKWVDDMVKGVTNKALLLPLNSLQGMADKHNKEVAVYPNWIITDMRFPNELKAIKDRGGITIRVNRDLKLKERQIGAAGFVSNKIIEQIHPSETALDNATFDYVIENNFGTIEDLIKQVKEILIKEKLIN